MLGTTERKAPNEQLLFKGDSAAIRAVKGHKERVWEVAFTKGGDSLLSLGGEGRVCLWDLAKECILSAEQKVTEGTERLCVSPTDSNLFLTAGTDKTLRLWDLRVKTAVRTEKTKGSCQCLAWKGDGSTTFAASIKDQGVCVWGSGIGPTFLKADVGTLRDGTSLGELGLALKDIAWDYSQRLFLATTSDKDYSLLIFDADKLAFPEEASLAVHAGSCFNLTIDPSGKYVATGGADHTIGVINAVEFITTKVITAVDATINRLAFSYDGQYLASATEQKQIVIYDPRTGEIIQTLDTPGPQESLAWHPSKYVLAFAGEDDSKEGKAEPTFRIIGLGKDNTTPQPAPLPTPVLTTPN